MIDKKIEKVVRREHGFYNLNEQSDLLGGLDQGSIWRWIKNGSYPEQTQLGKKRVGGRCTEINAWLDDPKKWKQENNK